MLEKISPSDAHTLQQELKVDSLERTRSLRCMQLTLQEYILTVQCLHNLLTDENEFIVLPQTEDTNKNPLV